MTFDYSKYTGGDFQQWNDAGDQIVGIIKNLREGQDYNGNPVPEVILEVNENGDEKTVTVSQARLKVLFAEKMPKEGDKIRVVYTGTSAGRGGRTIKDFTLDVQPGPHALVSPGPKDEEPF